MYPKRDYDLLYARLMNAMDATNKRLGTPSGDGDKRTHDTASMFQKAIAQELDPDESLLAAARCVVAGPLRPNDVILILLADRLFAVWDAGRLLIKTKVVVLPYALVEKATVGWGSGDYDGVVVLEVQGGEGLTVALVTKEPSNAQFVLDIIGGRRG